MLSPRRLGAILDALAAIPHVETIRIHTRVPVADPGAHHRGARGDALDTDKPLWLVAPRQPCARVHRGCACRPPPHAARGAFRCSANPSCCAASTTARTALEALFRAMLAAPREALLPAPARPGAGHRPLSCPDRGGPDAARARCAGASPASPGRPMCSTSPAAHGKVPIGPSYLDAQGTVRDPPASGMSCTTRHPQPACLPRGSAGARNPAFPILRSTRLHEAAGEPDPRRPGDRA